MGDVLPAVSAEAVAAFHAAARDIEGETVRRSLARTDEVAHLGSQAADAIATGLGFVSQFLETAMALGSLDVLETQMPWVVTRLPAAGIPPEQIRNELLIYADVIEELLTPQLGAQVSVYVRWMVTRIDDLMAEATKPVAPPTSD